MQEEKSETVENGGEKWLSFRATAPLVRRYEAWKKRFAEANAARSTKTDFALAYLLNKALIAEGFPPASIDDVDDPRR